MKHHTIERMNKFNREFSSAKDCYKKMQLAYLASKNKNVFFPMQHTTALDMSLYLRYQATSDDPTSDEAIHILRTLNQLYLFGTWRNTLGIYRLDAEILKDCKALPDDTPTEIFFNLPEWCVYLDISQANIAITQDDQNRHVKGFWACYDVIEVNNLEHRALNFIIDTDSDDDLYLPQPLYLHADMTIEQSMQYFDSVLESDESQSTLIKGLLPYLLWLCVAEPEITHRDEPIRRAELTRQKYSVNKKTGAFIPPDKPFLYEVGARLGGEIRKKQAEIEQGLSDGTRSMRPHIRRGHWHGYWKGTGQNRQFDVRWQPAIFVGMNN